MDELTFLLILAGVGIVLLVAMFSYYKHHKKIRDEIENFNNHANTIDDVLLQKNHDQSLFNKADDLSEHDLPNSFSASKQDNFSIDQINLNNDVTTINTTNQNTYSSDSSINDRVLVDGVYINSKRVIPNPNAQYKKEEIVTKTPEIFETQAEVETNQEQTLNNDPIQSSQIINVVYDSLPDNIEELIISHTILSKGEYFSGKKLFNIIKAAGLSYGEMNIFHFPADDKPETYALFSLANIVEPGTFDLTQVDNFSTPGVSMFMRLPTRIANNEAYDKFIQIAKMITEELNGELCDETRSQLTQQAITYKKEQIKKLDFEILKAKRLAK